MTETGQDRSPSLRRWKSRFERSWLGKSVPVVSIIATLAALGFSAALFIVAGGASTAADKPDSWLAYHLLHFIFQRSVASRAGKVSVPADLQSDARVRLAAQHFDMVCANCHGRPGFGQSAVALSMSPTPQYLPKVVGQFTDKELYLIVEHGVKYSAMPSWPTDARGDEVWSMVAFLRRLPKLDAGAYSAMAAAPAKQTPIAGGAVADANLRPANIRLPRQADEFMYAAPANGFFDQTIHDSPVSTCARCHGDDGSGRKTGDEAPNLTLQNADYLKASLYAYSNASRKSGFMQNVASQLSDAQIAALSTYYAGLPLQAAPPPGAAAKLVKRGETIAMEGVPDRAIPACANCHESPGSRITGAPHIAGQSATFLVRQLNAMGRGARGSTVRWNPMFAIAHDLADSDIASLAAYYSSLKPAKGAEGAQAAPKGSAPPANEHDTGAAKAIFAATCTKCHANGGRGDWGGDYPNLTIQAAPYVAQSLYAFHAHLRAGGKMQEVTNALSLDQLAKMAEFVNTLTPRKALAAPDAAAALRGARIATQGVPARGVPACLSCHDAKGVAALPLIPRLQGQNVLYLGRKLSRFAEEDGRESSLNPMPPIARQLTEQERKDVAAYFAAAPLIGKSARP